MSIEKIYFQNQDGAMLAAQLDLPNNGKPVAYALFAHCFTCSKNLKAISYISRSLVAEGIAILRFDFTGLGESEGDFSDTNFSSNKDDLISAAEFLGKEYEPPKILIGHSLGGAAVLLAAERIPSTKAVAVINAPSEPTHLIIHLESKREEIEEKGEAEISIAGRTFKIKKQLLEDLEQNHMEGKIRNLRKPLLILHSPTDNVVGIDNATRIFINAKHPKSFVSLDKADHLLSDQSDSLYAGSLIATWVKKYVN